MSNQINSKANAISAATVYAQILTGIFASPLSWQWRRYSEVTVFIGVQVEADHVILNYRHPGGCAPRPRPLNFEPGRRWQPNRGVTGQG